MFQSVQLQVLRKKGIAGDWQLHSTRKTERDTTTIWASLTLWPQETRWSPLSQRTIYSSVKIQILTPTSANEAH